MGYIVPKSIWFPDEEFEQLVTLAKQAGFRVARGRGSQLRLFVMAAANTASSGRLVSPPEKVDPKTKKVFAKVAGSPSRR